MKGTLRISFIAVVLTVAAVGGTVAQETVHKKADTLKREKVGFRQEVARDAAGRKRVERDHYRRTLGVDSAKADQVLRVSTEYKSGVAKVVSDTSLNDAGKRAAIDRLIVLKNRQLEGLLTPAQQSKVIPTTERRGGASKVQ
ncbi:hypothetical protein [Pedobacter helvus]|uniref:Uncharacterized protein n=1 Tax=Pedobacter helvus TaxID=2563444 RepID=A0ABW9JGD2_9SPHI|nr:hypothetical protein [Pedobacter ureilyticus]